MQSFLMFLGSLALLVGPLAVGIPLLIFLLKRVLAWADERGWVTYTGDVPTWGSLGNAFLEIQAIVQPQMEHVLEARHQDEEKVEQQDAGGPDEAGEDRPK